MMLARLMSWSRFGWHHGYTTQAVARDSKRTYTITKPKVSNG